jgi:hypothetical protein
MTWMRQPSWQGIAPFSLRMEFWRSTGPTAAWHWKRMTARNTALPKDSSSVPGNPRRFVDYNHDLKDIFKGAAMRASTAAGPMHDFYEALLAKGRKPTMARLTLARKIAAITLIVWKKEVRFDANYLKPQAT